MESVPQEVLKAFDCAGTPERLPGGEGNSFSVENTVFKPIHDIERYEWASEILLRIPQNGFRISTPLKSMQGRFTYAGWGATIYEPGEPINGRWSEKLEVCRAFHTAIQNLFIPSMPGSLDRWTQAHKIAWKESSLPQNIHPEIQRLLHPIFQEYQSLERMKHIIHGDMCGNILFAMDLAPVVIDFSPDYGPKEYSEAILVADAIAWEDAPVALLEDLPQTSYASQMLLRAVNFRLIVAAIFNPVEPAIFAYQYENYLPVLQRLA
jgi:uncharacterized protein (TIGR02569 family)